MKSSLIKKVIPNEILKKYLRKDNIEIVQDIDFNVVGIDIGYGYTKYTKGVDSHGEIICDLFPSLVAMSPQEDYSGGFFVERNTKKIEHGGMVWEVGPDVMDIVTKNDIRVLHENFINSEQWKILFFGALMHSGKTEIDMLVLGLPVSNMRKDKEMLKMAIGKHNINGVTYNVKDVRVVPQPLGSLYNHAISCNNFDVFSQTNTLIADPGFLTFDFLVTKGFAVNAPRTGARPGGMSSILGAIASSISRSENIDYDDINQIDECLNLKNYDGIKKERVIYINGKEVDLTKHITATTPIIDSSLHFMLNKIGDPKDVFQIILAGGPNAIFQKSISKQFPNHKISTLKDGIFSNVKGFMSMGMMDCYQLALTNQVTEPLVEQPQYTDVES